jgi:hypothetical protein
MLSPAAGSDHSRRTSVMKDASEKEASLLPGNITERTLMELCAAIKDVEVTYSLRNIGASVICSASERTVDTAPPSTGLVTVLPPNIAWSTTVVVIPTAVVAIPRVTAN